MFTYLLVTLVVADCSDSGQWSVFFVSLSQQAVSYIYKSGACGVTFSDQQTRETGPGSLLA